MRFHITENSRLRPGRKVPNSFYERRCGIKWSTKSNKLEFGLVAKTMIFHSKFLIGTSLVAEKV